MGFIKAFTGALSGTFADQWKDFYEPAAGLTATTAFSQAVRRDGGQNTKGNASIISNGSKIIVPEGMALVTFQDGGITGFIAEAGGYEFKSDDPNSQSLFAGDGLFKNVWQSTWDKVKFGGQVGSQQMAFYVNTQDIQGVRYGSQEPIMWNDSFLATKAKAMARGTYTLKISDPMLFVKNFVDAQYKVDGAPAFDFNDVDNTKAGNLNEQLGTVLASSITQFSIDAKTNNVDTVDYIITNNAKVCEALATGVESQYQWTTVNGLTISAVSIQITYDPATQELLDQAQAGDIAARNAAKMGAAYSDNMAGMMAAASGQAMQAAASNENGAMMGFMGMNMAQNSGANMMGAAANLQASTPQATPAPAAAPAEDPTQKLLDAKKLLDAGAISQADYDALKAKYLGL